MTLWVNFINRINSNPFAIHFEILLCLEAMKSMSFN